MVIFPITCTCTLFTCTVLYTAISKLVVLFQTDGSQDKAITGKKSTTISSMSHPHYCQALCSPAVTLHSVPTEDAIARLSTPKHVKKKTFTKGTNSSLRSMSVLFVYEQSPGIVCLGLKLTN